MRVFKLRPERGCVRRTSRRTPEYAGVFRAIRTLRLVLRTERRSANDFESTPYNPDLAFYFPACLNR